HGHGVPSRGESPGPGPQGPADQLLVKHITRRGPAKGYGRGGRSRPAAPAPAPALDLEVQAHLALAAGWPPRGLRAAVLRRRVADVAPDVPGEAPAAAQRDRTAHAPVEGNAVDARAVDRVRAVVGLAQAAPVHEAGSEVEVHARVDVHVAVAA